LYFLLRYGSGWVERLAEFTPLDLPTRQRLIHTVRDSVIANLSAMLAVIVAQGALLSVGFWYVGLYSPVLWGMLGGLASIVPVVGALLVWVPIAIAKVLEGAYWHALFLAIWGSLVVGSVDNVLRPWIIGKRNKLHPMLIAIAAMGGTYAFGAVGILLGPLLMTLLATISQEIRRMLEPRDEGASPGLPTVSLDGGAPVGGEGGGRDSLSGTQ